MSVFLSSVVQVMDIYTEMLETLEGDLERALINWTPVGKSEELGLVDGHRKEVSKEKSGPSGLQLTLKCGLLPEQMSCVFYPSQIHSRWRSKLEKEKVVVVDLLE